MQLELEIAVKLLACRFKKGSPMITKGLDYKTTLALFSKVSCAALYTALNLNSFLIKIKNCLANVNRHSAYPVAHRISDAFHGLSNLQSTYTRT
jgi:hypothetical protein